MKAHKLWPDILVQRHWLLLHRHQQMAKVYPALNHLLRLGKRHLWFLKHAFGFVPGSIGGIKPNVFDRSADSCCNRCRQLENYFQRICRCIRNGIVPEPGCRKRIYGDACSLSLVIGGLAFGAVFMATDPVTAVQTRQASGCAVC